MQLLLEYRGTGFQRLLEDGEIKTQYDHIHIDENLWRLAQTIDIVPESHPYVYGQRLLYTLARPIPRVLWPDKPLTPGFDLAQAIDCRGASLSSSVIADWYVMGGFPMIVLGGLFYGRLASTWSQLLAIPHNLVALIIYCLGAMAIFASIRSIDELVLQSYVLLAWFLVANLLLGLRRAAHHGH